MTVDQWNKLVWEASAVPTLLLGCFMLIGMIILGVAICDTHAKLNQFIEEISKMKGMIPKEIKHKEFHYTTIMENQNGKQESEETNSNNPQDRKGKVHVHRKDKRRGNSDVPKRNGKKSPLELVDAAETT